MHLYSPMTDIDNQTSVNYISKHTLCYNVLFVHADI